MERLSGVAFVIVVSSLQYHYRILPAATLAVVAAISGRLVGKVKRCFKRSMVTRVEAVL